MIGMEFDIRCFHLVGKFEKLMKLIILFQYLKGK